MPGTSIKHSSKCGSKTTNPKRKSSRPLSAWNLAMGEATKKLREEDSSLKGPDLFRKGAVLAHEIMKKKCTGTAAAEDKKEEKSKSTVQLDDKLVNKDINGGLDKDICPKQ